MLTRCILTARPPALRAARIIVAALLSAALFASCGGDSSPETAEAEQAAPAEVAESDSGAADAGVDTSDSLDKPEAPLPDGDVTELGIEDLIIGEGDPAEPGDNVVVHYVGVLATDGTEFDASYNRGQPFEFNLGQGRVIPGWDQGVAGMAPGGRRVLTIPSDLVYGPGGSGSIPGDADLVFVELVEGGATRLAAVFHSEEVRTVGPIRSMRTTDVKILQMLQQRQRLVKPTF